MKGVRAAVRYAKSLRQLSEEKNLLDTVVNDVKLIHATINENKELALMLESPLVKADKKASVLTAIFNEKINNLSANFIQMVVNQNRESSLERICEEFINQYNTLKNIARVKVITPQPLTNDLRDELVAKLKSEYHLSSVELEEEIDESLIGGMILRMGDKQLDASIRRQLKDIKQELVQA